MHHPVVGLPILLDVSGPALPLEEGGVGWVNEDKLRNALWEAVGVLKHVQAAQLTAYQNKVLGLGKGTGDKTS